MSLNKEQANELANLSDEPERKKSDVDNLHTMSGGYNFCSLILSAGLLLGPLMMGVTIACIGNDEYIKRCFYIMHFIKNNETADSINAKLFPSTTWSIGFLYPFGGLFGSIIAAVSVDKYGRKTPSLVFCFLAMIGSVLKFLSRYVHIALFFLSRFFDGVATAGMMVSVVILMFETLPASLERYFKPLVQINVNIGILFIGLSTLYSVVQVNWNFAQLILLGLSLILSICIFIIPESPKYTFYSTKDENKTKKILQQLRGKHFDQKELDKIKNDALESSGQKKMTIREFLKEKQFRLATISLIVLHLGQQLCGINCIMAFAPSLLMNSNFDKPDVCGVIVISIGLLGSIIFAPIVGNFKRKLFWMVGFVFMCISFTGYIISEYFQISSILSLFFLGLFVFMFQIGPGPVCWFISVEMFPIEAVGAAQGIAGFFNAFGNTLVYLFYPILEKKMSYYVLIIFIVFQIIVIVYSHFFVIETYNRSPQDVIAEYRKKMR